MNKPSQFKHLRQYTFGDALVVRVQEFKAILQPIIDEMDLAREEYIQGGIGGGKWGNDQLRLGGSTYLANEIGITNTRVREMMRRTDGYVDFSTVDRWLSALGLPHRMRELHFVPNPKWSTERWQRWAEENGHC